MSQVVKIYSEIWFLRIVYLFSIILNSQTGSLRHSKKVLGKALLLILKTGVFYFIYVEVFELLLALGYSVIQWLQPWAEKFVFPRHCLLSETPWMDYSLSKNSYFFLPYQVDLVGFFFFFFSSLCLYGRGIHESLVVLFATLLGKHWVGFAVHCIHEQQTWFPLELFIGCLGPKWKGDISVMVLSWLQGSPVLRDGLEKYIWIPAHFGGGGRLKSDMNWKLSPRDPQSPHATWWAW